MIFSNFQHCLPFVTFMIEIEETLTEIEFRPPSNDSQFAIRNQGHFTSINATYAQTMRII